MKVLFCTTGTAALGETFTVALFAKEIIDKGHECYFIAPILGRNYLQTFGFNVNNILVLPSKKNVGENFKKNQNFVEFTNFTKSINPDCIVVADWHHFQEDGDSPNNTYSLNWFDPEIKMGTFDHLGFAPDGIIRKSEKLPFQIKDYCPMSKRYSFVIRPCPHHDNIKQKEDNIYYWSLYNKQLDINTDLREEDIHKKYDTEGKKIIIHPLGFWQQSLVDGIFKYYNIDFDFYSDLFLPLMFKSLSKFDNEILYFFISGNVKEEKMEKYNNVTVIKKPPLGHNAFMNYLMASDIFITDNISSSNMGKAVFANKIPIVYKNSLDSQSDLSKLSFHLSSEALNFVQFLKGHNLLFPYLSYPLGLNELEGMYHDNTFSETFIQHELFDVCGNWELFDKIFNNNQFVNNLMDKQKRYVNGNCRLFSAEEILIDALVEKNVMSS
jgi:hypothetical protein